MFSCKSVKLFNILENTMSRNASSFTKSAKTKKLIKKGTYKPRRLNPGDDDDARIGQVSSNFPFASQFSYPETNGMILDPLSLSEAPEALDLLNAPPAALSPELEEDPLPYKPESPGNDGYWRGHYEEAISRLRHSDRIFSKRNSITKQNQYLSVGEAIELVNRKDHTLVSIDNEFYERNTKRVIEIGVSIYNPNYQQHSLFPHITNMHFIVKEFFKLRNGLFVPDSKTSNITGESYLIRACDVPDAMNKIFEILGPKTIIVGHSVKGDLESFKNLYWTPPLLPVIDTSKLWTSLFNAPNMKSRLSYVLDKLSVPHAFLHNGVNDSYYTLCACLMLCSPELRNNLTLRIKQKTLLPEDMGSENANTNVDTDLNNSSDPESESSGFEPVFERDNEIIDDSDSSVNREALSELATEQSTLQTNTNQTQTLCSPLDIISKGAKEPSKLINKNNTKKLKKKKKKVVEEVQAHIRCGISEDSIERKYSNQSKHKKPMYPPANHFFKPVAFSEAQLERRLKELML